MIKVKRAETSIPRTSWLKFLNDKSTVVRIARKNEKRAGATAELDEHDEKRATNDAYDKLASGWIGNEVATPLTTDECPTGKLNTKVDCF